MLHLITGTPGSGKTLYAVYLIDKQEIANKNALTYNAEQYNKNKKVIEDNDLHHYFNTHIYFSKITKAFETVFFEDDHFDYFSALERKENIFLDIKFYNDICKKIKDELNIELKQLKSVRHIYANIDGLKVDNVRQVEIDWRKCPDGSVIFYDEIQLLDEYSNDNKKDEQNIIKHLTIHRHRAFDIYGITQFPRLVNTGFRDVVGLHYHLHRGWGAKSATVYVWANCREKPNSLGNKFTAERNFRFNYPKRLYDVYESATADTVRLRIPTKFLLLLLIPIFGFFLVFTTLNSDNNFFKTIFGSEQQEQQQVVKTLNQEQSKNEVKKDDGTKSSEKTENEKLKEQVIELQKELEDLKNAQLQQYQALQQQPIVIDYNISKPLNNLDKVEYKYQATEKPRIAGCILDNDKCECYTQQGTTIKNMTYQDCKVYTLDRPFNPFGYDKQHQQNVLQTDNSTVSYISQNQQQQQNQITAEQLEKQQIYQQQQREYQRTYERQQNELNHGFSSQN